MAETLKKFLCKAGLSVILISGNLNLNAQQPFDKIDIFNLNILFLEQLTKRAIDSVRNTFNLPPLINDSICYLAALDQAYYLMDTEDFDHIQKNFPEKESPQKRVVFYGGKDYLSGENLARVYVNKISYYQKTKSETLSFYISTYGEAANILAFAWANSPEHFMNIVNRRFTHTGLAALINEDDNSLTCVQVFASIKKPSLSALSETNSVNSSLTISSLTFKDNDKEETYTYDKSKNWNFRYSDLLNKNFGNTFNTSSRISIITKGKDIFLNPGNDENWAKILNESVDGFSLEIIPYRKYDCSSNEYYTFNPRKPGSYAEKNNVTKPVYIKSNKLKTISKHPENQLIYIGSIPGNIQYLFETNILVLKDQYVIDVIPINYVYSEYIDLLNLMTKFNTETADDSGNFTPSNDSLDHDYSRLISHLRFVHDNRVNLKNHKDILDPSVKFIYNYFSDKSLTAEDRVNIAKYLVHFNEYNYAFSMLKPALDTDYRNAEAYKLFLSLYYAGKIERENHKDYYQKILDAADYLSDQEWIELFSGTCRLNIQLLDNEPLWFLYCNKKNGDNNSILKTMQVINKSE